MIPSPLPDPLPLLQAASMDIVMAALVDVPQEQRQQPGLSGDVARTPSLVAARERRVASIVSRRHRMPGWEPPTGRFKVLQKIDKTVWVHPVSGDRVADQSSANPLGSHWI